MKRDNVSVDTIKSHLQSLTLVQLKSLCQTHSLKVSGRKADLVERLLTNVEPEKLSSASPEKTPKSTTVKTNGRMQLKSIDKLLEKLNVEKIDSVSKCLKASMGKKYINMDVDNPLDQVICKATCLDCESKDIISVTVRDLLYQPDVAGLDYEDGGKNAPVKCKNCGDGMYVTGLCEGKFKFDSGKFHNHCTECKGFGKCIGDYRNEHCDNCGKHYFAGLMGSFPCKCSE